MSVKIDWRNVRNDKKSRVADLLQNDKFTDCQFLVGVETDKAVVKIRGHKLILAMASPVFEQMFYGSFDDDKSNEIRIPDIKYNIFRKMMDYIYFDELHLETVEDTFELYSAAKKFMLENLMGECIHYLNEHHSTSNVWKIYEFAVFFEENDLITRSGEWMAQHVMAVLKDPAFVDANLTTIITLFERDPLNNDSELDLFQALNEYALANGYLDTKNSVDNKEKESEIGKRKLLKEALKRIRFLRLTMEEFEIVAKSGLLTDSEVLSILWNLIYTGRKDHPMPEGFSLSISEREYDYYD